MARTQTATTLDAGSNAGSAPYSSPAQTARAANRVAANDPYRQQQITESLKAQFRTAMRDAERVPVTLAPSYRHPFGKVMCVRLNGLAIYIPCDGKTYMIPTPFAAIVHARRRAFDEMELRQEQMAQVSNNNEQFPGQRQFG